MISTLIIATLLIFFNVSQSYILLTANVDDIQALAQQLSRSPVAEDLHRIWRRASQQFQQQLRRPARQRNRYRSSEYNGRRSNVDDELVSWAKNASVYLKTFKRMLDNM